jgi:hypothetical protein
MMTVFEVHLAEGARASDVLSDEILRETNAQMMTLDEAKSVGFQGIEALAGAGEVRLIAVARRDAPWIHRSLETSDAVASFRMHDVD